MGARRICVAPAPTRSRALVVIEPVTQIAAPAPASPLADVRGQARRRAWRQTALISAVALLVFVAVRKLPPGGGALHYTDFHAGGKTFVEFCEPGSPQFAPVDRVHSPVALAIVAGAPLRENLPAQLTARLTTSSGRPVTADDLLLVHTQKLHLLIVDAALDDYQHVHPAATARPGEFAFAFTPRHAGRYRVFADFMPRATGRALYAGAELIVPGAASPAAPIERESLDATVAGVRFALVPAQRPVRVNQNVALKLEIAREDGAALELEDVMGAPAHLVAFDAVCSGFAHLHPLRASAPAVDANAAAPLAFSLQLTDPGFYRLWAQVRVAGRDVFVPFGIRVEP